MGYFQPYMFKQFESELKISKAVKFIETNNDLRFKQLDL